RVAVQPAGFVSARVQQHPRLLCERKQYLGDSLLQKPELLGRHDGQLPERPAVGGSTDAAQLVPVHVWGDVRLQVKVLGACRQESNFPARIAAARRSMSAESGR